ncbi:MAG: hypothetical protein K5841_05965, partial [Fretibacterium sp.]|nr:hypothetical protein [Fretibacterium sp.]
MRQDLTDWLNGESGTKGTGLLLAPLGASSDRPGTEKPNLLIATGTTAPKKEEKEETPQRVKAGPVPAAGLKPDPQPVPE